MYLGSGFSCMHIGSLVPVLHVLKRLSMRLLAACSLRMTEWRCWMLALRAPLVASDGHGSVSYLGCTVGPKQKPPPGLLDIFRLC